MRTIHGGWSRASGKGSALSQKVWRMPTGCCVRGSRLGCMEAGDRLKELQAQSPYRRSWPMCQSGDSDTSQIDACGHLAHSPSLTARGRG